MSDLKLEHALDVVRAVAADMSVSQTRTRERLEILRDEADAHISAILEKEGAEDEGILLDRPVCDRSEPSGR